MSPDPPTDGAPRIADYELLRQVGRGSYGEVWLARGVTGVYRAIKVVRRDRFEDDGPFDREFNGVSLFARLAEKEPRLLAVYHVGRNDAEGFYFYVMEPADDVVLGSEIVPGAYRPRTLQSEGGRPDRLPVADVVRLGIDLAEALAVLHRNEVVHRDIKPGNVIYVAGTLKLADIGLIAPLGSQSFVGTEGYVAPEGPGAPAADVFSLGKLLYELATGRDRRDYPRLPDSLEDSPETEALLELVGVLNQACARDVAVRYRDADELLEDLRVLRAGKSVEKLRGAQRRFQRARRVAGVLLVVAAIAGFGAWTERQRAKAADTARRWAVYSGLLARAQRAASMGDLPGARGFLEEPESRPPARRSVEWDLVERSVLGAGPLRTWATGSTGTVQIATAPEGTEALALDWSGNVWSTEGAGDRLRLSGRGFQALGPRERGGDRWLVQATNGSLGWLEPASGRFEERWRASLGLGASAWASQRVVLTNAYRHTAFEVWEASTEPPRRAFELPPDPTLPDTWGLALSEDGRWLAAGRFHAGRTGQRFDVWDIAQRRLAASIEVPEIVWAVACSPSGDEVAAIFDSGSVLRVPVGKAGDPRWTRAIPGRPSFLGYSSADGTLVVGLNAHEVAWVPEGRDEIGAGGPSRESGLTGIFSGGRWSRPLAQTSRMSATAWQPGPRRVLTGNAAGQVAAWAGQPVPVFHRYRPESNPSLRATVLSPDGSRFAVSAGSNAVDVVTLVDGTRRRLAGAWKPVAFASGGVLIAAGDAGYWVGWDLATGQRVWERVPTEGPEPVAQAGATADGEYLAMLSLDGWLRIRRRSEDREVVRARVMEGVPVAWARASDVPVLAGISVDRRIWTWRPGMTSPASIEEANGTPLSLALSADGGRLAVMTSNGALALYRAASLEPERPALRLPSREAFALAFTPDGERLMIGGSYGLIEFRETRTWAEAGSFSFDPEQLGDGIPRPQAFCFDTLGRRLVVALANGDVWWPVDPLAGGARP